MSEKLEFEDGRVRRKFTPEWSESGMIRKDAIPKLVASLVTQESEMVKYIAELHDKIDWILEKNGCCDIPSCFTAGCTSDHK